MTARPRFLNTLFSLLVVMTLCFSPLTAAQAQTGDDQSPWGEILNPDGSINWANLTYLGEVNEPAEWMYIELPGGIQMPLGEAAYNRYVTPSGNVLVLPSPATMFMTFLHPEESGFAAFPPEMLGSGHAVLAMLAADYIDFEQLQELGYVDPEDFFQAVIDGHENIWSAVSPSFLIDIVQMSLEAGYLVTTLWLYLSSAECDYIPGGCPPGEDDPTPGDPPPTGLCPAPSISFGNVSAAGEQVAPLKPVVIGQDPERRGADVELNLAIPPVVFTWRQAQPVSICHYSSSGSGGGCAGPGSNYDLVIAADGSLTTWNAGMENNAEWEAITDVECIPHVEILPDYLDYASLNISLSAESRDWILGTLAQAYPGARLKRPVWNFTFQGPGSQSGGHVVRWTQLVPNIQFADPGAYQMRLSGRTTGTLVSAPRNFDLVLDGFSVDLLRVTLDEIP